VSLVLLILQRSTSGARKPVRKTLALLKNVRPYQLL
jgi:hypothetical protein